MKRVHFKDLLAEPLRNGVYKSKEYHGSGVRLVNMKELFAFDVLSDQANSRIELTPKELAKSELRDGDLLFARRSFVLEGAGKCSLVAHPSEALTFESSMIRARPNPERADSRYLFYYFKSPQGRARMATIAARTAVSGITGSNLSVLEIEVPCVEVQRQIANVLKQLDDLIENNSRRVEVLEEMARTTYREWFVKFRYPGHGDIPLVNSALGRIPEGWEVKRLEEVATFVGGSTTTKASYVDSGYLAYSAAGPDGFLPDYEVDGDGIVLSAVGARCGRTFWASGRWSTIANTIKIIPRQPRESSIWLFHATQDPAIWPKRGSAQPFVSINDARGVTVVTADHATHERFEIFARCFFDESRRLNAQNDCLIRLRDLLLPKLVTGQVDVSALDLDAVVGDQVA